MATLVYGPDAFGQIWITAINDLRKNGIGAMGTPHYDASEMVIDAASASDLATAITLLKNIVRVYDGGQVPPTGGTAFVASVHKMPGHRVDTLAHKTADTTNATTSAIPSDLATSITLANELKGDYNAHLSQANVHENNDVTNNVSAANATDLASLITLVNQMKTKINAHMASALGGASLRTQPL